MISTAIIRQRGQLTIPDGVRRANPWLRDGEVVNLEVKEEGVVLKPHQKLKRNGFNWEEMWRRIELARSFKGKRGNLSEFIMKDRESH